MRQDSHEALLAHVESLLAEPQHAGHPMREALEALHRKFLQQQARLDRLVTISDVCQRLLQDEQIDLQKRHNDSQRRQNKVSKISDMYQQLMRDNNVMLSTAATHDMLTGLPNRRMIDDRLRMESKRAQRNGLTFTLAMIDIDHFKQVNDRLGHVIGDRVLVAAAEAMKHEMREYDLCGRWGGEEFLILLTETGLECARLIIDRVRGVLEQMIIEDYPPGITISAGLAEHVLTDTPWHTIERADRALYEAKLAGRNQCCVAA